MAIVVKLGCSKCGEVFDFNPAHYSLMGLKDIPKVCPKCADIRQGSKLSKIVMKRELINEWKGVLVESGDFLKSGEDRDKYVCKYYGGPNFGVYGGVRFSQRWLIFINKQIVEFPAIVDIREMKKIWGAEERRGENVYFVIDPSEIKEPKLYLYEVRHWYKTTLKGFGRDRDYAEHLEPVDGEGVEVKGEILCEVSSRCNSGRYGNRYQLVVTDKLCQVVSNGVA